MPDLVPLDIFFFMIVNFSSISEPTVWDSVINPSPSPLWFSGWFFALFLARGSGKNIQSRAPRTAPRISSERKTATLESATKDRWQKDTEVETAQKIGMESSFWEPGRRRNPKQTLAEFPPLRKGHPAWLSRQGTAWIRQSLMQPPSPLCGLSSSAFSPLQPCSARKGAVLVTKPVGCCCLRLRFCAVWPHPALPGAFPH